MASFLDADTAQRVVFSKIELLAASRNSCFQKTVSLHAGGAWERIIESLQRPRLDRVSDVCNVLDQ